MKRVKKRSKIGVFYIIVGCTWASVLAAFSRLLILMELKKVEKFI